MGPRREEDGLSVQRSTESCDRLQLAEVRPIKYRARDGMEVHGYLAIPAGLEPRNLPLVLNVHGGPWLRDYWTLNMWTQLLADRGYTVLQPNFRGSMGYGMKHLHAGDRQWGLRDAGRPDRCGEVGG